MNTQAPVIQQSRSMNDFRQGVDELLSRRQYFISKVLPQLVENQDYYVIKGKKSLAKGGAEKIASIYGYTASFEQDNETMKAFDGIKGIIAFICNLSKGERLVGQGRGASTLAKNDNDPNKTIKMSQKSAYCDSVIRASGLSDIFTQDLQDMATEGPTELQEINILSDGITQKQKDLLVSLLHQNLKDGRERDQWISTLDDLTKAEASDQIKSFIGTMGRRR